MDSLTVADLMNREASFLHPDDPLDTAEQVMKTACVRHWPVAREHSLAGVLSMRDLLTAHLPDAARARRRRERVKVGHLLGACLVAGPLEPAPIAAARMRNFHVTCLPVVDGGELLGVLTHDHVVAYTVRLLRHDEHVRGLIRMVSQLMTCAPLVTISSDERVDVAQVMMRHFQVRHLPVLDGDRHLVGIVSEGDLLRLLRTTGEPDWALSVAEAMTAAPRTVPPDGEAALAGTLLVHRHLGALPVQVGNELLGIITKTDMMRRCIAETLQSRERFDLAPQ